MALPWAQQQLSKSSLCMRTAQVSQTLTAGMCAVAESTKENAGRYQQRGLEQLRTQDDRTET